MAIEPTFDENGYPTEETLQVITKWPQVDGYDALMNFVGKAWRWPDYISCTPMPGTGFIYECHTGGWSGNEDIVAALKANMLFWLMCWQESRRGGHYKFEVTQ